MSPRTRRYWIFASLVVLGVSAPASAQRFSGQVRAREQAVKQMPIEQRPNRLGHVYGNNVRRMQTGRLVVNTSQPGVNGFRGAARRFFYLP